MFTYASIVRIVWRGRRLVSFCVYWCSYDVARLLRDAGYDAYVDDDDDVIVRFHWNVMEIARIARG